MIPSDRDLLLEEEIHEAANWIEKFLEQQTEDTFIADEVISCAVMYKLQNIGEAVKRLSEGYKIRKPDVPWKQIAGMRDILVHDYTKVDRAAVWEAATKNMPELLENLN
ncbi:MAG: DUF86 domain-containing protein [Candidatus Berkelbacteria bacterium]|nr:DUF86 domain-containing protein [Candidatus Berkelbacteria bacterium]